MDLSVNATANGQNLDNKSGNIRSEKIKVKAGENLTVIAKRYNMTATQFKEWTGLTKTQVNVGQVINLPTAQALKGKGIYAIAREYGMSINDFCKLNNIPKNYSAKAGEVFYVKKKSTSALKSNTDKKSDVPKIKQKNDTTQKPANVEVKDSTKNKVVRKKNPIQINHEKWNSDYTPGELAKKLHDAADDNKAAVGKFVFDSLLKQVNSKNASKVIDEYNKLNTGETLIETIVDEVGSSKDSRKEAVMHIYDSLAKEFKTSPEMRKLFETELNAQFDSFGFVSTKKLDKMISNMKPSTNNIAKNMKDIIHGALTYIVDDDFKMYMHQITPDNVENVLKAYEKLGTGESLIKAITHEVGIQDKIRKNYVMQIYDKVAKAKGFSEDQRTAFKAELDKQFDSWGMVDTKVLDKMLAGESNYYVPASKNMDLPVKPTFISDPHGEEDSRKIKLSNGKEFTVKELRRDAKNQMQKLIENDFKKYCKDNKIPYNLNMLDYSVEKQVPIPEVKDGKIVSYVSGLLKPTTKPNGKLVIVNPGHNSYNSRSGAYDPGARSFVKKANGRYAPVIEGEIMQKYADSFTQQLRDAGYAVIITNHDLLTLFDQQTLRHVVKDWKKDPNIKPGDDSENDKKYDLKDMSFISFHADSGSGTEKGSSICYDPRFEDDTQFAKLLNKHLNEDSWIQSDVSQRTKNVGKGGLQVLYQTENIPSVLVEVEYLNGAHSSNLDSKAYQAHIQNQLLDGLNKHYGFNQKK